MKWSSLNCLLVLILYVAPGACAQSSWNGAYWKTKLRDFKVLYVVGFVDGRNDGVNQAVAAVGTTLSDSNIKKLDSKITVGQIVDGLDDFYGDERNSNILVRDAIDYVLLQKQGNDGSQLLRWMQKRARPNIVEPH